MFLARIGFHVHTTLSSLSGQWSNSFRNAAFFFSSTPVRYEPGRRKCGNNSLGHGLSFFFANLLFKLLSVYCFLLFLELSLILTLADFAACQSVIDSQRNVVSFTSTLEENMGCGVVVPGRGFLLNNEVSFCCKNSKLQIQI